MPAMQRVTALCGVTTISFVLLSLMVPAATAWPGPDDVILTGMVRDFHASHPDFGDPEPNYGYGHYAGNVSQIIGDDGAPLQVHGVTNFEIDFGSLVPGDPYAARATVLGAEITSGGNPIPVTIQCETDTQVFEPYGAYLDPGGSGNVNDGTNPRHFIFSLDEVYSAETPISVTATSWLPGFASQDFGDPTVFSTDNGEAQGDQVATLVTLPEDGTVTSITAYLYRDSNDSNDIRYAIYSDIGGEPGDLIVETSQGNQAQNWAWEELGITDTWLAAGDYWLAVAMDDDDQELREENGTNGKVRRINHDGVDGFRSSWGTSDESWNNQSISMYASFTADTPTYTQYITARSGDNSPQVVVLKNGDDVPSIPAFQDQTNLAVFVDPYVNVATGKIVLQDNQAIYLFELGTSNLSSPSADFQDLVIMITLATDPVYFLSPDTISEGLDPIGYKVESQWEDADGNNIAPHLYTPALGDEAGVSGETSSGAVTSPATFFEWHRDILGTNMAAPWELLMKYKGSGVWEHKTGNFFPINGLLYGNESENKNWNFTYSAVANFVYDQTDDQFFEFKGGDGVWLFVNGKLLIDLGGVDSSVKQYGDVDRLGLVHGERYEMRLFYANRGKDKKFEFSTNVFLTPGPLEGALTGSFD